jgi:predicted secreted Zn-dependent protease
MQAAPRLALIAACLALCVEPARANWKPVEKVETYAISGATGIDLYRSIGEKGPKIGVGRAIAYTDFDLKWSRDYRPQPDGSCTLVTARPHVIITYRLPKPAGALPAATKARWDAFIAGITAHEKVHGEMIVDLVKAIEAVSVGLTAADDRKCQKVRADLQSKLGPLSQAQRARSRAFDQEEMSNGGNVHQLILALVN